MRKVRNLDFGDFQKSEIFLDHHSAVRTGKYFLDFRMTEKVSLTSDMEPTIIFLRKLNKMLFV